jgi:hypothetical protein
VYVWRLCGHVSVPLLTSRRSLEEARLFARFVSVSAEDGGFLENGCGCSSDPLLLSDDAEAAAAAATADGVSRPLFGGGDLSVLTAALVVAALAVSLPVRGASSILPCSSSTPAALAAAAAAAAVPLASSSYGTGSNVSSHAGNFAGVGFDRL